MVDLLNVTVPEDPCAKHPIQLCTVSGELHRDRLHDFASVDDVPGSWNSPCSRH